MQEGPLTQSGRRCVSWTSSVFSCVESSAMGKRRRNSLLILSLDTTRRHRIGKLQFGAIRFACLRNGTISVPYLQIPARLHLSTKWRMPAPATVVHAIADSAKTAQVSED